MDIDRLQRKDIDDAANDRITLAIDAISTMESPYILDDVDGYKGSNWLLAGEKYVKYNIAEEDSLVFLYSPVRDLSEKNIICITVSFDYLLDEYVAPIVLDNISLIHDSVDFTITGLELNGEGHMDVNCSLFGIDNHVLNGIISGEGFGIGLNFKGNNSNASVSIGNVKLVFEYDDDLQDEINAVANRFIAGLSASRNDDVSDDVNTYKAIMDLFTGSDDSSSETDDAISDALGGVHQHWFGTTQGNSFTSDENYQDIVVSCQDFVKTEGAVISVYMFMFNKESLIPRLNINSTGLSEVVWNPTHVIINQNPNLQLTLRKKYRYVVWSPYEIVTFVYRGGFYHMVDGGFATTGIFGVTKLQDSIDSNTTFAVTPNAVNTALTGKADKSEVYTKSEVDSLVSEYVVGTHGTTTTSTWTGTCKKLTEVKDGTVIFFYLTSAGSGTSVTLNLTLADGTTTGAKNVYFKNTTRLTTQYPINSIIGLAYTTKRDSGAWYVITPNDNNSWYATEYGGVQIGAGESIASGCLCGAKKSDGKYYKLADGLVLDASQPIIQSSISYTTSTTSTNGLYEKRYDLLVTPTKSMTLTAPKPVYIEGTSYENGQFTVSSNVLTQTLTSGRYYWLIGFAYTSTYLRFDGTNKTIYYYDGTTLTTELEEINHAIESKIEKGIIDGGVNLLTPNRPTPTGTGGGTMVENGTLYGEPIYEFDLSSNSDTTKYNDFYFVVTPDKFSKGDIFTLSFWAKGNNGNILKTYFAGTSGYVNVKRLHSNSTFTGNAVEGSFGDGITTYNLTTDWQHYYVTYQLNTTGNDTLNKSIHLRVFGGNKIDVSRIKLERGEVATDYSSKYNQTTKVPHGANLNDYIRGGFYYNNNNTECANISNLAETGKAFWLLVEDWETSSSNYTRYTKQTITHFNRTYVRIKNNGIWGNWREMALKDEVNTLLSAKVDKSNGASQMTDSSAYDNLGTNSNATQSTINTAINTVIGDIYDSVEGKRNIQRAYCEVPDDAVEEGHYYKLGGIVYAMQNQGMSFLDVMVDDFDRLVQVCYEYDYGEAPDNDVHQYIRYSTNNGSTWSSWKRFVEEAEFTTALNGKASSTHSHGNILNGGTITQTGTNGGNLVVTNTNNAVVVESVLDVMDRLIQSLINYGGS